MKQSLYAIGIFMLIVSGHVSAQTTETSFITKSSIVNSPFVTGKSRTVDATMVSVTALERFRKDYKDARDVEWAEVPNGYRACFLQNAVPTAVDYTRKGKLYSVIRYGKNLLSPYLKMQLEETFDGLQVREVADVKMAEFATRAYVVVLEDRTTLKTVQIIEGEISVIHEVEKAATRK
jgi:hypothetical protein